MQEQRISALEAQMGNMEIRWQEEKKIILNALKAERAGRKAEKRARNKVQMRDVGLPGPSIPVELRDSPSTEQDLSTQLKELTTDNAALKKMVSDNKLQWEEEKRKLIRALKAERAGRKRAVAQMKAMDKVQLGDGSLPGPSSPVELQEDTPSREQDLSTQLKEITNDNATLNQLVSDNKLQWEEEKRKIIAHLKPKRWFQKAGMENVQLGDASLRGPSSPVDLSPQLKELADKNKVSHLENTIKLLSQQIIDLQVSNLELQVLSEQSDKEKAQVKKIAKKAAKEAEKKLAKERKETEKEEDKVLKTQKKQRKEKAKQDAKELKKQAKERKLREKRGEAIVISVANEASG